MLRMLLAPLTPKIRAVSRPYLGGVAQLGERLLCKQEVIGSIPFTSTTISRSEIVVSGASAIPWNSAEAARCRMGLRPPAR